MKKESIKAVRDSALMANRDRPATGFAKGYQQFVFPGLSKREEFTKAAMAAILTNAALTASLLAEGHTSKDLAEVAELSIAMADTILDELERTK